MDINEKKAEIKRMAEAVNFQPFPRDLERNRDIPGAELLPASTFASIERFLSAANKTEFAESYANINGFSDTREMLTFTLKKFEEAEGHFQDGGDEYLKMHSEIVKRLLDYLETP